MEASYEQAYLKLEKLVDDLESDDCSLEESLKKYEEAISLYKHCSKILNDYEGKVKTLIDEANKIHEEDLYNGDDDEGQQ